MAALRSFSSAWSSGEKSQAMKIQPEMTVLAQGIEAQLARFLEVGAREVTETRSRVVHQKTANDVIACCRGLPAIPIGSQQQGAHFLLPPLASTHSLAVTFDLTLLMVITSR